jgi:hypothetical protein
MREAVANAGSRKASMAPEWGTFWFFFVQAKKKSPALSGQKNTEIFCRKILKTPALRGIKEAKKWTPQNLNTDISRFIFRWSL